MEVSNETFAAPLLMGALWGAGVPRSHAPVREARRHVSRLGVAKSAG